MHYVIDSREKKPFDIPNSISKKLETGDYSVEGYEDEIALERKSLPDLFSCLGKDRKRFECQLDRLSEIRYGGVVITSSYSNIQWGYLYSDLSGDQAQSKLIGLSLEYNIPVWLVSNRDEGTKLSLKFLSHAYSKLA